MIISRCHYAVLALSYGNLNANHIQALYFVIYWSTFLRGLSKVICDCTVLKMMNIFSFFSIVMTVECRLIVLWSSLWSSWVLTWCPSVRTKAEKTHFTVILLVITFTRSVILAHIHFHTFTAYVLKRILLAYWQHVKYWCFKHQMLNINVVHANYI